MATKINLGSVRYSYKGAWVSGYTFTSELDGTTKTGYLINDTVKHNNNLYISLVDDNTVEPGTDSTKWDEAINGEDYADAATNAQEAADNANAKATLANTAAETANTAATSANNAASAALAAQTSLQSDVTGLLAANGSYAYYAAGRVAGATSCAFTKEYGTREGLLATLSHLKIGIVKDGEVVHECAPGRCDLDVQGNDVAIDGSEGDVCLYTDEAIYTDRNRGTIGDDTCNIMSLGLIPHLVGSMAAVKYEPFFMAADYTVNCKLDGDTRSQAHCIYNESVAGQYNAPSALFKETYKPNGYGYPSQYMSSLNASQQARNKNTDASSNTPCQGLFYGWEEIWWQAMYMELGTLDITATTNFGYGCTNTGASATTFADSAMSGISGIKLITSDGTASYSSIWSEGLRIGASGSNVNLLAGLVGTSYYGFLQNLIHLRIFNNITKNGLTSYVGNSGAVFTDLGASVVTDGSIDLSTGDGMTANTLYCQVRNVPNCQGIADGIMTGVINIYVMMDIADGVYKSDGTTDMTDGKAIFKFSLPVYRGKALFKGMFTQTEGMYYRQSNSGGTITNECWSVDRPENVPVIGSSTGYYDGAELTGILKGLTLRFTKSNNGGWIKDSDYSVSMFAHETTGGSQHSYEAAYLWNDRSWGAPNATSGVLADGHSCVNASVVGCDAHVGAAGRTLDAAYAAADGHDYCAGAFAGFLSKAKQSSATAAASA